MTEDPDADLVALVERYAQLVDARRFDALDTVFTVDAVLETGNGRRDGLDAIQAAMAGLHRYDRTEHRVVTPWIETDGDGGIGRVDATAHHWFVADGTARDRQMTIVYHDRYRRTPAGWRIRTRRLEITGDVEIALD